MNIGLCAAIGDFDGIHIGHTAVIKCAVKYCGELTPAVYTFSKNCKNAPMITNNSAKSLLLQKLGIQKIIFDDYNDIKDLSPAFFVKEILKSRYNIQKIICGKDFRFGKNAVGDTAVLKEICVQNGIELLTVEPLMIDKQKISSSTIRNFIESGDMQNASKLLGYDFFVSGTVIHGKSLGRTKKSPTVNIPLDDDCVHPAYGVYITKTTIDDKCYNSVSNVGIRPSVENTHKPNIETNIFDFNRDIYGKEITVQFIKMIRREIKFESTDCLFDQIQKDILSAKNYFIGESNV